MQSILGQPCDICGDIGIAQAIVTCSNCHKSREHIYCMHPNLCSVPKSWFCNPCQYHVNHHDNCHSECSTHRGQELEDLSIRENACVMANESFKVPDVTKMGDIRTLKGSFSSDFLPTPDITSVGNDHVYQCSDHPECLTVGRVQASAPEKQNHEISQPLHDCESSLNFPGKSLSTGKFESVGVITTKGKLHINDEARRSPLNYDRPLVYGVEVKSQIEKLSLGVDKQAGKMGPLLSEDCICKEKPGEADLRCQEDDTLNSKGSLKFVEEDIPKPPAVNSLWKGSFAVLDFYDELYEGVEAYPPRKLSRKAYLVSKEMPSTLQFKLMPRLHVWPKTFHRASPSAFDISLYFRADDRCRENYNHLMQWMVEKDLSMVSRLNGMKLLIFTSSQLPVESQRLNKQIFLWGVFISVEGRHSYVDFRGKQEVNSPLLRSGISEDSVTSNENNDQVVDMEIDMVETKEVGSANICSRNNSKIVYWENPDIHPQDAFMKVHSDRSRYLNQTIRDPYEDFDVPPGFKRQVALEGQNFSVDMKVKQHLSAAPVLNYNNIHEDSTGVIDKIDDPDVDMDVDVTGGKDVGKADIRFRCNSMAECLDNLDTPSQDVLTRVNLDQSNDAADKGFISISLLTVSTVHPKEDASPGISDSTKLVEGDSSAKFEYFCHKMQQQRFNQHQQEVLMQQAPIQKQVMMQHASLQQQQSMYQPSLLPSPEVKGTPSEDLPPGFEHPGRLSSYKVEPITNENLRPGFDQPCLLQSPQMKAIQSRTMSPGFFQIEPMRSGNVPPGFDQPSNLASLHRELSSRDNLNPGFGTSASHSVYVSNIPSQVKEPLLLEIFKVAGAVEGCKLIGEGGSSYGFVNYFDHQSAEHAISTLNGRPLFGQPIIVRWAHETLLRGPFTIFVGHLCPEITDANLFAFFSVFPSCLAARVARDHTHGISKLYGFVSFGDQQDAQNAIHNFSGKWLGNRQITCNWATKVAGPNDVQHR